MVGYEDEMYNRTDWDCAEHNIKDTADQVKVGLFHSILLAISNLPPPQVRRNKGVRGTFDFM